MSKVLLPGFAQSFIVNYGEMIFNLWYLLIAIKEYLKYLK